MSCKYRALLATYKKLYRQNDGRILLSQMCNEFVKITYAALCFSFL